MDHEAKICENNEEVLSHPGWDEASQQIHHLPRLLRSHFATLHTLAFQTPNERIELQ
jgi:hypothetical protein